MSARRVNCVNGTARPALLTANELAAYGLTGNSMPSDTDIIARAETRMARRRAAPFVAMALPQLAALRSSLPSYVAEAIDALIAAFEKWEADEKKGGA